MYTPAPNISGLKWIGNATFDIKNLPIGNCSVFGLFEEDNFNITTVRWIWSGTFLVALLSSLVGNALIFMAIQQRSIRVSRVMTTVILHIAISDVAQTLLSILPIFITVATDRWVFGKHFCLFQAIFRDALTNTSTCLVSLLNATKLFSLLYPLRAKTHSGKLGHITSGLVWVLFCGGRLVFYVSISIDTFVEVNFLLDMTCDGVVVQLLPYKVLTSLHAVGLLVIILTTLGVVVIALRRTRVNWQGIVTVVAVSGLATVSYTPELWIKMKNFDGNELEIYENQKTRWIIAHLVSYLNNIANAPVYYFSIASFGEFVRQKVERLIKGGPQQQQIVLF
eukprot:sb/3466504/